MRKLFVCLLVLALLVVPVSAQTSLVADELNLLTQDQSAALNERLVAYHNDYEVSIAVVTTDNLNGSTIEVYAQVGNRTVMFQVPQYAPELGDQCWDQVIQDKLNRKPSIRDKLAAAKNECADRPSQERHHRRSEQEL